MPDSVHRKGCSGGWQFVLMCAIHGNRDFCGRENKIVADRH